MSAPVTADWGTIRDTAVALDNISEAARQHGVSIDAACQRAKREGWPVGRRPAKAVEAAKAVVRGQIEARTGVVRTVRTTADVIADTLAEDERETRISLSKSARKLAKDAEVAPLTQAGDVLQAAKTAALVHRWDAGTSGGVSVNILFQ